MKTRKKLHLTMNCSKEKFEVGSRRIHREFPQSHRHIQIHRSHCQENGEIECIVGMLGLFLDDKTAFQLALDNIDPHNLSKVLDNFDPNRFSVVKYKSMRNVCNFPSLWRRSGFQEAMEKKKSPLLPRPAQSI